jgi:stearoyl-CoA desaturase (Delta-9 desaturase)
MNDMAALPSARGASMAVSATAPAQPVVHTLPATAFGAAQQRHFLGALVLPTVVMVAAPWLPGAWSPWHSPGWALLIWGVMWFLVGGVGVSVGLHRCFSHRSFEAAPALRAVLGVLGGMAAQGPVLYWVSLHRLHHAASDQMGDPHSPQARAWSSPAHPLPRWRAALQGHLGWVLSHDVPKPTRYARELLADPLARRLSRGYSASVALGVLLPAAAGAALLHGSPGHSVWTAALFGAYWGGALRIALGHHIIWAINSWCHLGAARPHATPDHSANVAVLALLSWGESWHNNHHAQPTSPRFGQGLVQVDVGWWVVRGFVALGWARLREPAATAKG